MSADRPSRWRVIALVAAGLASLLGFFLVGPIAQDQAYHRFADDRGWLGIPNFMNVVTNLPFVGVGAWGLAVCRRTSAEARAAWATFFAGVLLVGLGSGYYHWSPSDATLVWDRLPMTLGFVGLTVAILVEWVSPRARWLLPWGLALGVGSVLVWAGTGDLRLYYGVQLMPLVLATLALVLYRAPFTRSWHLGVAVALYAGAKLVEAGDRALFDATGGALSGHPVKHVLAAGATFWILDMLRVRGARPA
ncbi:MAG: ceramidase domain-containing protein [Deltaproteobacteria bacterium]|nr:ceramidase domain-containing protein [Deltaproteobacteria bacterium]